MAQSDEMTDTTYEGTTVRRLDRIETKLDTFIAEHGRTHDAEREVWGQIKKDADAVHPKLRELEDWRLEVTVYLKQAKWAVMLAGGALIAGVLNILLNVALVSTK